MRDAWFVRTDQLTSIVQSAGPKFGTKQSSVSPPAVILILPLLNLAVSPVTAPPCASFLETLSMHSPVVFFLFVHAMSTASSMNSFAPSFGSDIVSVRQLVLPS